MPLYEVDVLETCVAHKLYLVIADNPRHAREMAEIGNTFKEEYIADMGVTDRQLMDSVKEIER
jgi:hypothetical protein